MSWRVSASLISRSFHSDMASLVDDQYEEASDRLQEKATGNPARSLLWVIVTE